MAGQSSADAAIKSLAPRDLVKSCKYIEKGTYFALEGVRCCVHANIASPVIVTADEIKSSTDTYDLVVQRRQALFAAINGLSGTDRFLLILRPPQGEEVQRRGL